MPTRTPGWPKGAKKKNSPDAEISVRLDHQGSGFSQEWGEARAKGG
jgi:hypothetical protein